jgi:protein-S-isoprenylcysteine O-methyltransferase Ste14
MSFPFRVRNYSGMPIRRINPVDTAGFSFALVSVREGQTLVRKGPHRYVHHPSCTGAIMIFTGIGLALRYWGAVLVLLAGFFCCQEDPLRRVK